MTTVTTEDELVLTIEYKGKKATKKFDEDISKSVISGIGSQPILKTVISLLRQLHVELKREKNE
ncbi:MAG: hypothetical protein ACOCVF_04340 [bacterium]